MKANLLSFKGMLQEAATINGATLSSEYNVVKTSVVKRYNDLCKQGKAFALLTEIERAINARIDTANGHNDMLSAFEGMKEGQAIAFRGRLPERTGKRLFVRSSPLPIFPGTEDFVKSLVKKSLKKGVFCTLTKGKNGSYTQTVYELIKQGETLVAKRLQCTVLRGTSDSAYIAGCKSALSGLSFR